MSEGNLIIENANPIFIGIDLSLTGTGLCRYFPKNDKHETKLIATSPKDFANRWLRYGHIAKEVIDFVWREIDGKVKFVVLEDYIVCPGNIETTKQLIELGALVRHQLTTDEGDGCGTIPASDQIIAPWMTVVGSQLKKWITGHGKGDKSIIIKEVYKQLNQDVNNDNLADAIVLAHVAADLHHFKHFKQEPSQQYRLEVLKKVLKNREVINPDRWIP